MFFLELLLDQHCQARCHSSRQQAGPRSSFSIHAVRTTKSVVRWHEARRAMATRDSSRFASRYAGRTPGTARAASMSATVFLAFRCRPTFLMSILCCYHYLNCCAAHTRDWIRSLLQRPSLYESPWLPCIPPQVKGPFIRCRTIRNDDPTGHAPRIPLRSLRRVWWKRKRGWPA